MEKPTKERIARSASRVSGATMVSRVLGLVRDGVFAALFGTTYFADAFMVAFLIPNFLRRVFGEGMLHSSYVPVYTHYLHRNGRESAIQLAARVFSVLTVIMILVVSLGVVFSDGVVKTYAFGWRDSPQTFTLTVKLARILFPYIFFIGLASLAGGTLNSLGYFTIPAIAPAFLNIALVATGFTLMRMGSGAGESAVTLFALGALMGGLLQVAIQLPHLFRTGHRVKFDPDFRDPGVRWVGRLMLPGLLAFAVTQINILVDTLLATMLPEGSVTALRLGNRIAVQPMGVFGVAITTAALPTLSEHVARKDHAKLVEDFAFSIKLMLALLIPSTVGLMVLARPVVRLLFERGEFSAARSTPMTSQALFYYAMGLFAYGGVKAMVQVFYSLKDTVTPMKVAIINVCLNITLNLILVRYYGLVGLALATSIASSVGFMILSLLLKRRLGYVGEKEIWVAVLKIILASVVMGLVIYTLASRLEVGAVDIWGKVAQVGISGMAGLATFICLAFFLRVKEVIFLLGLLTRSGSRR